MLQNSALTFPLSKLLETSNARSGVFGSAQLVFFTASIWYRCYFLISVGSAAVVQHAENPEKVVLAPLYLFTTYASDERK